MNGKIHPIDVYEASRCLELNAVVFVFIEIYFDFNYIVICINKLFVYVYMCISSNEM